MNLNQEEKWLLEEKHDGLKNKAFQADLKRLAAGEPLAYIIGHVTFLGCVISLDSHPLIPRPETEFWVEKAITSIPKVGLTKSNLKILDLCSGSGCIGVAVAKAVPSAHITFAEIDATHLPTIEKNIQKNLSQTSSTPNLSIDGKVLETSNKQNPKHLSIRMDRYEIIQSDLFENISGKFDVILTNPPYIDPAVDRADSSVKSYEPHSALYGGVHGLELILTIIRDSKNYMNEGGQLWIEHEPEQTAAIHKSAEAGGFSATNHQDQYGIKRYSVLNI